MSLIIRHAELTDVEAIHRLYTEPSSCACTLQLPFQSINRWHRRIEQASEHQHSLVAMTEGQLLGQLSIDVVNHPRRKHVASIGMAVSEQARGQGVGASLLQAAIDFAHGWLGASRIELEVYTDNQAAIRLYQQHGFEIEGTAKQYALRAGQYVDAHYMARVQFGANR